MMILKYTVVSGNHDSIIYFRNTFSGTADGEIYGQAKLTRLSEENLKKYSRLSS